MRIAGDARGRGILLGRVDFSHLPSFCGVGGKLLKNNVFTSRCASAAGSSETVLGCWEDCAGGQERSSQGVARELDAVVHVTEPGGALGSCPRVPRRAACVPGRDEWSRPHPPRLRGPVPFVSGYPCCRTLGTGPGRVRSAAIDAPGLGQGPGGANGAGVAGGDRAEAGSPLRGGGGASRRGGAERRRCGGRRALWLVRVSSRRGGIP